jgi:hypothetical protein
MVTRTNYLAMSDEEMMNLPGPSASEQKEEPEAASEEKEVEAEDKEVAAPVSEEKGEDSDEAEGGTPDAKDEDEAEKPEEVVEPKAEKPVAEEKPAEVAEEPAAVNYEAEHKKLLAPFKANGREIQVQSVDEAISLMQMGANYNKKMAALKPNLKLMKMLENNGLMSAEKISFLIDLDKKDPAAINKLVKDSGLDPLDLTAEKAEAYKQSSYAVGDQELELDTVLEDLKDTSTYTQTLDVVSNKWDGASKQIVAQHPQLLTVINDHIASGIYGLISNEVERERTFGRLQGLSDIEAYRQVGDAMNAAGRFNHLASKPDGKPASAPVVVAPKAKPPVDAKLNEKRRAASSNPTPSPAAGAKEDFNPLALSDEEFGKLINQRVL